MAPCLLHTDKKACSCKTASLQFSTKVCGNSLVEEHFFSWKCFIYFLFPRQCRVNAPWAPLCKVAVVSSQVRLNRRTCKTVHLRWIFFKASPSKTNQMVSHCSPYIRIRLNRVCLNGSLLYWQFSWTIGATTVKPIWQPQVGLSLWLAWEQ